MAEPQSCADLGCESVETPQICTFPADPDIAGIGVILSFFIAVTLTFLLTLYGFYFIKGGYIKNHLTTLDIVITGPVNAWIGSLLHNEKPVITQQVFREVILLFSDQQLITGLAILVVAFSRFNTLTQYHFAVVTDLADMALVVQFSACSILGEALRHRPEMIWWRASAFITLAVLSTITLIPSGNQYYLYTYGSEMSCLWDMTHGNYTSHHTAQMVIYMVLSFWGIVEVMGEYFPVLTDNRFCSGIRDLIIGCILWPRRQYIKLSQPDSPSITSIILRLALGGLTFVIFVVTEVVYAEAFELIRNWSMLLVNVVEVFRLRARAPGYGREGNEDVWGFGQAVPMFMLILPLCTLVELYFDGYFKRQITEAQLLNNQHTVTELLALHTLGVPSTSKDPTNSAVTPAQPRRLSAPLPTTPRAPSPAPGHTHPEAPELYLTDETNSGNYYFSYPAVKLGRTDFEDQLYGTIWFRMFMRSIMGGAFVGLTVAARYGWAF